MRRRLTALVASACLVVAPLTVSLALSAPAADAAGSTASCSCSASTGDFVTPATGTLISGQTSSAGAYTAEWNSNGTVAVKKSGATVMTVIGTIGGFSKNQQAFVVESNAGGHITVALYNLASATPGTIVWQADETVTSNALIFSPTGHYLELAWTTADNVTHFQIADATAVTMQPALTTPEVTAAAPPGSGNQVLGTVSAGWGPDDRVFTYGAIATGGVSWYWVDLTSSARPVRSDQNIQATSSYVEFSPCGEDLAIVSSANGASVDINLFNTGTGQAAGGASSVSTSGGVTLSATDASYVAYLGATDPAHTRVLAANGCSTDTGGGTGGTGGTGGSAPQTGDFVVPAGGTSVSGQVTSAGAYAAAWNGDNTVTITRSGTAVATVAGTVGGFGPGQKTFVAETLTGGVTSVNLYNLTSSNPGTSIFSAGRAVTSDALIFSPKGSYFLYASTTTGNVTHLQIADATATAARPAVWSFDVTSNASPGTGSATISQVGTVRYGWAPGEKSFAVGALNAGGQAVWSWTDLSAAHPATRSSGNLVAASSYVAYCPCGNAIAIVTSSGSGNADVFLDDASTGGALGSATNVATSGQPIALTASATSFEALIGGADAAHTHVLAPNTCPAASGTGGGDDGGGSDGGGGDDGGGGGPAGPTDGAPAASFTAPDLLLAGLELSFTDTSTDDNGTIIDWAWDFGDGTTIRKQNPTHTYRDPGAYTVSLTITDSGPAGHTDTTSAALVVAPDQPPVASFSYAPDPVSHGDTVTFTSTSTDPDDGVASLHWYDEATGRHGDGDTFSVQICSLTTVELTAYDHAGQSGYIQQDLGADVSQTYPVPAGASLADALAAPKLCPGDTLQLAAGTYAGGVEDQMVNLVGAGPGRTIISGNTGNPDCRSCAVIDVQSQQQIVDSMSISQLTIRDSVGDGGWNDGGWGVALGASVTGAEVDLDHVELTANNQGGAMIASDWSGGLGVSHSSIHDNGGPGIDLEVDRSFLDVSDTDVADNAGSGIQTGERANNSNVTVTNSHLRGNTGPDELDSQGGGLHLDGAEVTLTGTEIDANTGGILFGESVHGTVSGNTIHDNSGAGLVTSDASELDVLDNRFVANEGAGVELLGLQGSLTFAGNLVARNTGVGVAYGSSSGNVPTLTVADNTVADNGGLGLSGAGADLVLANNILTRDNTNGDTADGADPADSDDPATGELDPDAVVCGLTSNLVGTDPKFADTLDYHLAPGSAAIDAGDDASVPAVLALDADGDPRIAGTAVDIGYDETTGTGGHAGAGAAATGCDAQFHSEAGGALDPGQAGSTSTGAPSPDAPLIVTVEAPTSLLPGMQPGDHYYYDTTADQHPYENVPPLQRWRVGVYGSETISDPWAADGSVTAPFTITFDIDASLLGRAKAADVVVSENGELLPQCLNLDTADVTDPDLNLCAPGPLVIADCADSSSLDPDPCVARREDTDGGDARITVLAAHPFDLKDATTNPHQGPATWTLATPGVASVPTTVSLAADQSEVPTGTPVRYTATVSPAVDGGTVTFDDAGGNPLSGCSAVAVEADSTATCQTGYDTAGTPAVTAVYNGDALFAASEPSAALSVTVTADSDGTGSDGTGSDGTGSDGTSSDGTGSDGTGSDGTSSDAPPTTGIVFTAPTGVTYGDAPTTLTATGPDGATVQFTASPASVCTVSGATLTVTGAGDCTVTASADGADPVSDVVPVSRANLTITAGEASMTAGGDLPTVSPSYDGFVDGDTPADLDQPPTCTADPDARSTSCAGAASANYRISYLDGVLRVTDPGGRASATGSVENSSAGAGEDDTVSAAGFDADEEVEADLHSAVVRIGVFRADSQGAVTFTFTIPASLAAGRHHIVLTGLGSGRTVSIPLTVTAPTPGTTTGPSNTAPSNTGPSNTAPSNRATAPGGLAVTGSPVLAWLVYALTSIACGLALIRLSRRPYGPHHAHRR